MVNEKVLFSFLEDENLVECVAQNPCLFDLANVLYKNNTVKNRAWKEISECLGRSVGDCKKRWRNIRDTYYKRRKKAKVLGSGDVTNPKQWPLIEMLSFLDKVEHKRLFDPSTIQEKGIEYECSMEEKPSTSQQMDEPTNSSQIGYSLKRSSASTATSPSKRQKLDETTALQIKDNRAEGNKANYPTQIGEDDVDLFFKSIAVSVKKLAPDLVNEAKLKSLQMVFELESRQHIQNTLQNNTTDPSSPSHNSSNTYVYSMPAGTGSISNNSTTITVDVDPFFCRL